HGRKILGGRVNHQRFDFFPYVELVGAIAPIDVLHLQVGEGGVESQFDGIGQTRPYLREDGSMKHRTHLLASPQPTHCYEKPDEQGTSLRKSSRWIRLVSRDDYGLRKQLAGIGLELGIQP